MYDFEKSWKCQFQEIVGHVPVCRYDKANRSKAK